MLVLREAVERIPTKEVQRIGDSREPATGRNRSKQGPQRVASASEGRPEVPGPLPYR